MKRFRFRLQRVLDTKEDIEKMRQRELGKAQRELDSEERRLNRLNTEMTEQKDRQRNLVSGSAKVVDLVLNHRWQRELNKRIRNQSEEVKRCGEVVEEKRKVLVEASREKKVLERLKEKKHEEHRYQELNNEQKNLDDLGTRRRSNRSLN